MNASLKNLASAYDGRIKYVLHNAKDRLGVSAALIRPDGMVAWACDQNPDSREFENAAARWFIL